MCTLKKQLNYYITYSFDWQFSVDFSSCLYNKLNLCSFNRGTVFHWTSAWTIWSVPYRWTVELALIFPYHRLDYNEYPYVNIFSHLYKYLEEGNFNEQKCLDKMAFLLEKTMWTRAEGKKSYQGISFSPDHRVWYFFYWWWGVTEDFRTRHVIWSELGFRMINLEV